MKNVFVLLFAVAILAACNKENEVPEIVGTWELTEILLDPGDGSGTFTSVDSDRTLEFLEGERVHSNGSLCFMTTTADPDNESTASYNFIDESITIGDCNGMPMTLFYKRDGLELQLNYPCIEPCAVKYRKVE